MIILRIMERISKGDRIKQALDENGVEVIRFSNNVFSTDYLPERGMFCNYIIIKQPIPYVRLESTNGGSIDLSSLICLIFIGEVESASFWKINNKDSPYFNSYALKGHTVINPQLGGPMYHIIERLIDKEFIAEKVSGLVLPRIKGIKYMTETEARNSLIKRDFYKINFV